MDRLLRSTIRQAPPQNLYQDLKALLLQDQSFILEGVILKNAVVEAALNMEPRLIEPPLHCDAIRRHPFTDVAGTLVFDNVRLQDFIANNVRTRFIPDAAITLT